LVVVALVLGDCALKPPARTALQGDLPSLKRDIASAQRAGKLDHGAVVDLARALGEREVMSAQGSDGAERMRTLRGCARPLASVIERRAEADDDVAAELTLILLEQRGADRVALMKRYANASNPGFRAVAARAAVRPVDSDVRRRFFTDPDERVRRAALAAARDAHQAEELDALLEAARLDPDPQSQSLAAHAAGAIGGERAVLALKDLWVQADDQLRIAIVDGWAEKLSFTTGGQRELVAAADAHAGLASVSAAYALVRMGSEFNASNARLRRSMLEGTDDEKRLALSVAPINTENEAALLEVSKSASPELRVAALARLTSVPDQRSDAVHALRGFANTQARSEADARARGAALTALAETGDTTVEPTLVSGLSAKDRETRRRSAYGLTSLGAYSAAAPALADDDVSLRTDLACSILAREAIARR